MLVAVVYVLLAGAALCLFCLVAGPPLTLLHELGHALPLALAGQEATVHLGSPRRPARRSFTLGGVRVKLRYVSGFSGVCLYEEPESGFSPEGRLLVALGGPAVSALVSLALGLLSYLTPGALLSALLGAVSVAAFLQVVLALIPLRYPRWLGARAGIPSDGLRAIRAMGLVREDAET